MWKPVVETETCEGMPRSLSLSRPDGQLHVQWYRSDSMACYPAHKHAEFNIVVNLKGAVETAAAQDAVLEQRQKAMGYGAVLEGLATRILVETLRVWPRNRVERTAAEPAPCLSRRDHIRALEFMCWCRKDEFRLDNLCRFLGTSEEKFTRLFRTSTGDSPASFYNRLLLDRSTELLSESGLSVKETGYQLGFKTPSHFVVAFRRQFGVTPMEYRRESRSGSGSRQA